MGRKIDLTGETFCRLTVESESPERKNGGSVRWICNCICGCQIIVSSNSLKTGNTKSCGCLNYDGEYRRRNFNKYDLDGTFGIGYTNKQEPFYFDLEDYDLIKIYNWYCDGKGYICAKSYLTNSKIILMHRIIMDITNSNIFVDHKNRIVYDNRKDNLREATLRQNTYNKKVPSNNSSGIMGVRWISKRKKWRVSIRSKTIAECENINDAIRIRLIQEKECFGEFAPQKHLFEEYGV
jgi:hypothetical protein